LTSQEPNVLPAGVTPVEAAREFFYENWPSIYFEDDYFVDESDVAKQLKLYKPYVVVKEDTEINEEAVNFIVNYVMTELPVDKSDNKFIKASIPYNESTTYELVLERKPLGFVFNPDFKRPPAPEPFKLDYGIEFHEDWDYENILKNDDQEDIEEIYNLTVVPHLNILCHIKWQNYFDIGLWYLEIPEDFLADPVKKDFPSFFKVLTACRHDLEIEEFEETYKEATNSKYATYASCSLKTYLCD
jgi:hypothetical protein